MNPRILFLLLLGLAAGPLAAANLRHRVTWKDAEFAKVPAGDVMIRIHLENAEVFALTIE